MTLDDLGRDPDLASTLSRKELVDLYRQAARIEAELRVLVVSHTAEAPGDDAASNLLTLAEVAKVLSIHESKAYDLARRGELPTIAVPGGKYVRVRRADLDLWIDKHKLPLVTSPRDQARIRTAPKAARALTSATRRRNGHHQGVDLAVGSRRAADLGAGGPVSATPGRDAG